MSEKRECGSCTLCCKVMAVQEINKPQDEWCEHCDPKHGCKIYADRPNSCQIFDCLWLQGSLPLEMQPNKIHAVFWVNMDNTTIVVGVDQDFPGARYKEPLSTLIDKVPGIMPLVLINGNERVMLFKGKQSDVEETLEKTFEKVKHSKIPSKFIITDK